MANIVHDVTIREEEANIHIVSCSCGFSRGAPFGPEQARQITERHLGRLGYAPSPRGALYQ